MAGHIVGKNEIQAHREAVVFPMGTLRQLICNLKHVGNRSQM